MEDRMPHGRERRTRFDDFAEGAARFVSDAPFFAACVLLIVLWVPTMFFMEMERSHLLIETATGIITLLLVALLQNAQKRSEEAVNLKLNAVAQAVADLMRERTGEEKDLRDNIEQLTDTVGLEERTTTDRKSRVGNRRRDDKDSDGAEDGRRVTAESR
ncbi:MAG: low affinity iron permease family protein [Actinomycetota bacterium]|nr:low affinity iron permease family protein [Actinomycetota bacterium]